MIVGALKENGRGEARVAVTPQSVPKLIKLGYEVMVETRAGYWPISPTNFTPKPVRPSAPERRF